MASIFDQFKKQAPKGTAATCTMDKENNCFVITVPALPEPRVTDKGAGNNMIFAESGWSRPTGLSIEGQALVFQAQVSCKVPKD